MNEFNTHEWRRNNIHENEIPPSPKIMNEIMDIILDIQPYGGDEIPHYKYDELAEDIYKYIYKNFIFKQ
jgi:hypothetical protein